jgi:hypothetical protein
VDRLKKYETQEQLEPLDKEKLVLVGTTMTSSKKKESWTTIVKNKKTPSISQSMVTRIRSHNLV